MIEEGPEDLERKGCMVGTEAALRGKSIGLEISSP